jgi:hypothetical protein
MVNNNLTHRRYTRLVHTSPRSAILIPGNQLSDSGKISESLKRRLDIAVARFHQGNEEVMITTGWYALKHPELKRFCEARAMASYIHEKHGAAIPVLEEPDSLTLPENLLFARARYPSVSRWHIVISEKMAPRVQYFAQMFLTNAATGALDVTYTLTSDGLGNKWEDRLLSDAKCMLGSVEGMAPGRYELLLTDQDGEGRLRSRWDELRLAHHNCPYYRTDHPH